jgi:hypothetical protein
MDPTTARPTPKVPMNALSRTAAADLEASSTSHARSALMAKLSA